MVPSVPTTTNPQRGCGWWVHGSVKVPQRVCSVERPPGYDAMTTDCSSTSSPGATCVRRGDLRGEFTAAEPGAQSCAVAEVVEERAAAAFLLVPPRRATGLWVECPLGL